MGHGLRANTPRSKMRGSSQGSVQSLSSMAAVGPAPTTKPPTPPQVRGVGTLSKSSQYRTPPAVAPPQASRPVTATLRRPGQVG